MTIYAVRRRVVCYVTRTAELGGELLVLDSAADDPRSPSGAQVPAGTMLPYEALADAGRRATAEETGLAAAYIGQVGAVELGLHDISGPSMTNFVHLQAPGDGPDSWEHSVSGDGENHGLVRQCRWEPLPLRFDLAAGQGEFLDAVLS